MPSYPGQDTGYVPAREKTMIFIPSTGGSHNPDENTKKKFIQLATTLFTQLSKELLVERFRDAQKVLNTPKSTYTSSHLPTSKVSNRGTPDENVLD